MLYFGNCTYALRKCFSSSSTSRDRNVSMDVVKDYEQLFYLRPETSEGGIKSCGSRTKGTRITQQKKEGQKRNTSSGIILTRLQRQWLWSTYMSRSIVHKKAVENFLGFPESEARMCNYKRWSTETSKGWAWLGIYCSSARKLIGP